MRFLLATVMGVVVASAGSAQTTDPFADIKKAAAAGDAQAQWRLGMAYDDRDVGTPQNDVEACRWFQKAANAGYPPGQNMLALCYGLGKGGFPRDRVQAAIWYRKAAEQDYIAAEVNLGRSYRHGYGVKRDYAEALTWFRKAADQGSGSAEYALGEMYERGEGVPNDRAVALQHYLVAADHIQPAAFLKLATIYEEATARDLIEAYKWYSLFIPFSGDKDSAYRAHRDALAAQMTPADIAEAEKRTDLWGQAHKKRRP